MWETIDTAPQDGTTVLVFCPAYERKVNFGYYYDYESFEYGVSVDTRRGWVVAGGQAVGATPTHWMPLPADPE